MSDIEIVQFDPDTGLATLGLGNSPKILTGMDKLKQIVVLAYLRNPGQDIFDPQEGSGLRAEIGQFTFVEGDEVSALFVQRTQGVEKEIIDRQEGTVSDASEKLKKLSVLDVAFDQTSSSLLGRVQIINQAGDVTDILV